MKAFTLLLNLATSFLCAQHTDVNPGNPPYVSVVLPADIRSQDVQIRYFMIGPFGGYGSYVQPQPDLHSIQIAASVQGKAATEIRAIVYARGCGIQTFALPLQNNSITKKEFWCRHLPIITLDGQISPRDLIQDRSPELVVTYMARWSHRFFGITDGPVVQLIIATVIPDSTGLFRADLPDFSSDAASSLQQDASFYLSLRGAKTWNPIASDLHPEVAEFQSGYSGLRICPNYPSGLKFTTRPRY